MPTRYKIGTNNRTDNDIDHIEEGQIAFEIHSAAYPDLETLGFKPV